MTKRMTAPRRRDASCSSSASARAAARTTRLGLPEQVKVVPAGVRSWTERDVIEAGAEPLPHVLRRVVRAAEARACGPFVQHDDLPILEGLELGARQPVERRVVLAERRDQQVPPGPEHAAALGDPFVLERLRQVREDGEGVNEVELFA